MKLKIVLLIVFLVGMLSSINAQSKSSSAKSKKLSMSILKDSLDNNLDLSDFLISYHGFIPMVQLITEPALGGIGGSFAPLFIKPNKHQEEGEYIAPNITVATVGYTANESWFVGGMRSATLPKHGLKYRAGVGYGDINMDFYRDLPVVGNQEFGFNFNMFLVFVVALKQIGDTDLYIGPEYFYLHNKQKPEFEASRFPDVMDRTEFSDNISSLGINIDFDKRDNVFTPNKGLYITADFRVNEKWTGSDYNFENIHLGVFQYFNFTPKWVSGFRYEMNLQFGNAPFYMKPAISLRGVPMGKYQGNQTFVLETEQRYDWTMRWSSVVFGGLAKAPTKDVSFDDTKLVYNYGTGFRYLIARKFKLRAGVDFAWSNKDFGWYVVLGCAWNSSN